MLAEDGVYELNSATRITETEHHDFDVICPSNSYPTILQAIFNQSSVSYELSESHLKACGDVSAIEIDFSDKVPYRIRIL